VRKQEPRKIRKERDRNDHEQGLKARRVEAGITRKTAAEVAGISQFKLDRIERGVDVGEDVRKAYDAGMAKLLKLAAEQAKTQSAAKTQPAQDRTSAGL
jgi:DNA-binding XRE family transcriptional regulator